jgi:hypothetical protein
MPIYRLLIGVLKMIKDLKIVSTNEELSKLIEEANVNLLSVQKSIEHINNKQEDCKQQQSAFDIYLIEEYLLGALLIDNSLFDKEIASLQGMYDFHKPETSTVFDLMRKLKEQNKAINPTSIAEELKKYLIELIKNAPNPPNIESYLEAIREESSFPFKAL